LESAVVSPSDEDSNTFSVNSWNGECYKLRAVDARARQDWVNRLRAAAEYHSQVYIKLTLKKIYLNQCSNYIPIFRKMYKNTHEQIMCMIFAQVELKDHWPTHDNIYLRLKTILLTWLVS